MTAALIALLAVTVGGVAGFHIGRAYQASLTRKALRLSPAAIRELQIGNYSGRQR